MLRSIPLKKLAKSSIARSVGIKRTTSLRRKEKEELEYEDRKNRHEKTPADKRIPGLDISLLTSEQLEFFLTLKLDNHPLTKNWKIKAAHELSARYIEGSTRKQGEKAPHDQVKAYEYAEKEINCYSIEELEENFFLIDVAGKNINISNFWLQKANRWRTSFHDTKRLYEISEIDKFIAQAEWNGRLKEGKARNANGILLAWEKQLIASRLAAHYKKLKKEKRDAESILAARFYKRLVHHLEEHELPDSKISFALKKISPRFNQIRLMFSRIGKIFSVIKGSLPPLIRWVFAGLSLYFLLELITDITVLIKEGRGAFWEDNRPSRMANAAFWFPVNLACLVLAILSLPGVAIIAATTAAFWIGVLTVTGCAFDVVQEMGIGIYAYKLIREQRVAIDQELENYTHIDVNKKFTTKERQNNPNEVAGALEMIAKKQALLDIREQIIKKRNELDYNRAYMIVIMTILVASAAFILFPPLGAMLMPAALATFLGPWVPLVAASVALVAGSVFGGIGRFLYLNGSDLFHSIKEKLGHTYSSFQKWRGLKVKSKLACTDDWQIDYTKNTKQINDDLKAADSTTPGLLTHSGTEPKPHVNYTLHRSPSGTLFTVAPIKVDIDSATTVMAPIIPRIV